MTRVHTRLTHREMQLAPAETHQPVEIVGTGTKWLPLMVMVLCFVLVGML